MEKAINHFCHEHPLFLTEQFDEDQTLDCYVCGDVVDNLESAYSCKQPHLGSSSRFIIHKRCGELPRRILSSPSHSQHPLHLCDYRCMPKGYFCDPCGNTIGSKLGYRCPSCDFDTHIKCSSLGLLKEREELQHPSHIHPLTLMRKHALQFSCDGCGTQDVDMAYVCSTCEYWVHVTCASLPILLSQDRHQHNHQLSLAFCFPMKHRRYRYKCAVCDKEFDMACWLYFCGDCRYFVHLKCVTSITDTTKQSIDQSDVVQFPLADISISSMLITPFVMREKGIIIPNVNDMPRTITLSNYHKHPLSLVSEDEDDDDEGKGKALKDDEDEDDEELKICDVCITPISSPPYYHCPSCKYFIHLICCMLPKTFSSSSSPSSSDYECRDSDDKNHKFALYGSSEDPSLDNRCDLCGYFTNGIVYRCEKCEMIIDVKCASLPPAIKHASHSHSHPNLIMSTMRRTEKGKQSKCYCCGYFIETSFGYICSKDGCEFALDLRCAQLPLAVRKPEWDHHPLLFTSDASADHPSDFFCEFCEKEMHPKQWMYHCRQCDQSYHTYCLEAESGWYRNIKFGHRFEMDSIHPHPLTYNYITLKKRCDICHGPLYTYPGFECVSCYFVVCIYCKALAKKM